MKRAWPRRRGRAIGALFSFALAATLSGEPVTAEAAFPGRNGKIAFLRSGSIFVINPDGGGLRRLTRRFKVDYLDWSPDGRNIAFSRACSIYVMRADGRRVRRLSRRPRRPGGLCAIQPTWSPDGKRIAFVKRRKLRGLPIGAVYSMSASGAGERPLSQKRLTRASFDDSFPAWSPDGAKVAFGRDTHGGEVPTPALYVMNADGTGQVRLRAAESDSALIMENMPDWSPDGERIAIGTLRLVRGPDGNFVNIGFIYVMTPSGGERTNVTKVEDEPGDRFPAWSPEGHSIAYENVGIGVMARDGSGRKMLTNNGRDEQPTWQPLP